MRPGPCWGPRGADGTRVEGGSLGFKKVGPQWNCSWGRSWDGQASPPHFHPGITGPSPTFFFQEPRTPGTASWSRLMASLCGRRGRGLRELGGERAGAQRRVKAQRRQWAKEGVPCILRGEGPRGQRDAGATGGLDGDSQAPRGSHHVPGRCPCPQLSPSCPFFLRHQRTPEPQPT